MLLATCIGIYEFPHANSIVDELIRLMKKIATQRRPVGLEVRYDGQKWRWTMKLSNLTAEEFEPIRDNRHHLVVLKQKTLDSQQTAE